MFIRSNIESERQEIDILLALVLKTQGLIGKTRQIANRWHPSDVLILKGILSTELAKRAFLTLSSQIWTLNKLFEWQEQYSKESIIN